MRSHRLRRVLSSLPLITSLRIFAATLTAALATAAPASALPPCSDATTGWCVALRIEGDVPGGELGFRFGEPLDADGDGIPDVWAGSRYKRIGDKFECGSASVWSGKDGSRIHGWDGTLDKGLFGHWVLPLPDLDGDRLADVVIAAPSARIENRTHGVLSARSGKTGEVLWRVIAKRSEHLGWDMSPAGDQTGDGVVDLFVGSPSPAEEPGQVYLINGKTGGFLRSYTAPVFRRSFGWYVSDTADLDGDGRRDLLVGNRQGPATPADSESIVYLVSAASGIVLREWKEADQTRAFGEVVAGLCDVNGDGRGDVAIGAAGTSDDSSSLTGEVRVYSGADGTELRRFAGKQAGEWYGRMVTDAGDIDGDGVCDVAIGAPRFAAESRPFVGRVEVRSGRTGDVVVEWIGQEADGWFGWHVRRAGNPTGGRGPALLIASLRRQVGGVRGTGVIEYVVLRPGGSDPEAARAAR